MKSLDTDEGKALLRSIKTISRKIHRHETALAGLYEQRVALYEQGRSLHPKPLTQSKMAAAAGVSEVAVIQAIRKREDRRRTGQVA